MAPNNDINTITRNLLEMKPMAIPATACIPNDVLLDINVIILNLVIFHTHASITVILLLFISFIELPMLSKAKHG